MSVSISVIVPVYNSDEYLTCCLESLAGQSMQELEFLCVDDGSTDQSGAILDHFAEKDSRFRVFHQANAGSSLSRNLALKNARGQFIMFCDSDDWYEPNMCERMYHAIEEQNVDLVMCNTQILRVIERSQYMPEESGLFPLSAGVHKIDESNMNTINVLLWNKIFRKSIIDRTCLCFPPVLCADDDIFVQCYRCCIDSIFMLDEKLYHYRVRENSIMDNFVKTKSFKHCLTYIEKNFYIYDFLVRNGLFKKYKMDFYVNLQNDIANVWNDILPKDQYVFCSTIHHLLVTTHYRCKHARFWLLFNAFKSKHYDKARRILAGFLVHPWILRLRSFRYSFLSLFAVGELRARYNAKKFAVNDELQRLNEWKKKHDVHIEK